MKPHTVSHCLLQVSKFRVLVSTPALDLFSKPHSAGYSAGFRAHSAGTKSQQHAHICIQNSLSAMLVTTEAEAGGGG